MKTSIFHRNFILSSIFILIFISAKITAQNQIENWTIDWTLPKAFIENKGQFDGRNNLHDNKILYGIDHGSIETFFTSSGLTFRFDSIYKNTDRIKGDSTKPKKLIKTQYFHMEWIGANPNVEVIAGEMNPDYHTYSVLSSDRSYCYEIPNIKGYKTITYKNLYEGIDVVYEFHPSGGFKYSFLIHVGADPNQIKMKYSDNSVVQLTSDGKIHIETMYGNIVEHAPYSFYQLNNIPIASSFVLENNILSFNIANYDNSSPIIIDPWVQTPTLANSNGVWECESDNAGNVYVIGGDMPMKLQKYNSSGALQWTYSTPWDTANFWLGTLATDQNGVSYITSGSVAAIQKISTAGGMMWSANGGSMDEYWIITFNCDNSKLVVGGTRLNPIFLDDSHGVIFDININNGSVLNYVEVANVRPSFMINDPNEVRALSSSRNARYYYLTLDTIGCINQNFSLCSTNNDPVFNINSGYQFGYKCENFRPNNGNAGIMSIRANNLFVYSQNGTTVHKRNLDNGSILSSAPITGGISTSSLGFNQPGNSGLAVDDCGNVYVGSGDRVIKFDGNLNVISSVNTGYPIFDIAVSTGGNIIVCGTTGTSSSMSRTGYIQQINMSACAPFALSCCYSSICPAGPFCHDDPPFQLVVEQTGGTFSGPGVNATGLFDPSIAGPGTHTITYTLACGSSNITIIVNLCASLSVCEETNGDFTVSGGTGPYTWQYWSPAQSIPITNQTECQNCGYTWFFGSCLNGMIPVTTCNMPAGWVTYNTGTTVPPPPGYPIQVLDNASNSVVYSSSSEILPCSACPTLTITASNLVHVACYGGSTGSFSVSTTGGASPYDYTLMLGASTIATYTNVAGSQNFTGLAAGTYTLNVLDNNNCPGSITITINQPTAIAPGNPLVTDASCGASNGAITMSASGGTPGYTFSWSTTPPQSGATITNLAAGTYTVTITDNNGCTTTAQATVNNSGAPTVSVTGIDAHCGNSDGSATATPSGGTAPYDYEWSCIPIQTTQTMNNVPSGTYTVTVTDDNGCIVMGSVTIGDTPAPTVTTTGNDANCGVSDGNATANPSGGTSPYDYEWNCTPVQTTQTMTNVPAGSYTVTVTDDNGCTATASIIINNIGGPSVVTSFTTAVCGQANGSASVTATGGSGTYTYIWSTTPVQNTQTATGLTAGTYTVTVDDGVCSAIGSVVVPDSVIIIQVSITSVIDASCGSPTGSATANATNGTAPHSYEWNSSPVQTGSTLLNVVAGTYVVTVTDAGGCSGTASVTIQDTPGPSLAVSSTPETCDQENGTASVSVSGGSGVYSYTWSSGDTTALISGLISGNYSVTVDDGGCTASATVTVSSTPGPIASFTAHPTIVTLMDGAVNFNDQSIGNIVFWDWDFGDGSPHGTGSQTSHIYSETGEYIVILIVTDANGCTDTTSSTIYVRENMTIYIPNSFSPNGDGLNDGFSPVGLNVDPDNFEMYIFNRWGELLYYTNEWGITTAEEPWNGTLNNTGSHKDAVMDVYVYRIIIKEMDGYKNQYIGIITLIK